MDSSGQGDSKGQTWVTTLRHGPPSTDRGGHRVDFKAQHHLKGKIIQEEI